MPRDRSDVDRTTFEITWSQRADVGVFELRPVGPAPGHDREQDEDESVASPPVPWGWHIAPAPVPEVRRAHGDLIESLLAAGWERAGEGKEWFSQRFRPGRGVDALSASLVDTFTVSASERGDAGDAPQLAEPAGSALGGTEPFRAALAAILTVGLARTFTDPAELGRLAIAAGVSVLAVSVADTGISRPLARALIRRRTRPRPGPPVVRTLAARLLVLAAAGALVAVAAGSIAAAYGDAPLAEPMRAMAATAVAHGALLICVPVAGALGRPAASRRGEVMALAAGVAGSLVLAVDGDAAAAAWGLFAGVTCGALACASITLLLLRGRRSVAVAQAATTDAAATNRLPGALLLIDAVVPAGGASVLVAAGQMNVATAGALQLALVVLAVAQVLGFAASRGLARCLARRPGDEAAGDALLLSLRRLFACVCVLLAPVAVWSSDIVKLAGSAADGSTASAVVALTPAMLLAAVAPSLSVAVIYCGAARARLGVLAATFAVAGTGTVLLVPGLGVQGAAMATTAGLGFGVAAQAWLCRRLLRGRVREIAESLGATLTAAGAMAMVLVGSYQVGPQVRLIGAAAALVAYVSLLVFTREIRARNLLPIWSRARRAAAALRAPGDEPAPPEEVSYRSTALRGGALSFAGYATSQGLNFLAYAVLARLISPAEFGTFVAGALISGVAMMFSESGMLAALITRRDGIDEAASTTVVWNIVAGTALVILSLATAPAIGAIFGSTAVANVSAALSGVVFLRALGIVPDALLQRRFSFARRVVIEPLGVVIFAAVAISLAASGAGIWGLVAGTYAAMVTRTALAWAFVEWRPRLRLASIPMWRELIGFARPVLLSELVRRLVTQLDVLVVGRFVGLAPLGQYRYASRLASLPLAIWVSVGAYVLLPVFSRLAVDPPRLRAACLQTTRWMATAVFPASLILFALGVPAAVLAFGDQWRQAGEAVTALAAYPLGHALVSVASEAFKATGHPKELPKVHLVSLVTTVVCMVALLPWGVLGVAAGVSLAALLTAAYAVLRMDRVVGTPWRDVTAVLLPPLGCAALTGVAGYAINGLVVHAERYELVAGLALLAAQAIALLALYAVAMAVVSPVTRHDAVHAAGALLDRSRLRTG